MIYGSGWQGRLAATSRLAPPELLASMVAQGLAAGKSHQEIARDLLPHVDGVRASARRVARTEAMRVSQFMQEKAQEGLGDLVIGQQVRAVLDTVTRPWHAARSGQIYYYDPKPGQKGPAQMPHPPDEPEDPTERPPNTPKTAPNCRCHTIAVLRPNKEIEDNPVFTNARNQLVPAPDVYSAWFDQATEQQRRLAVGTGRYSLVADQSSRRPEWADFLNAQTGDLLSKAHLERESHTAREKRIAKVNAKLERLRKDYRGVSQYGFAPTT